MYTNLYRHMKKAIASPVLSRIRYIFIAEEEFEMVTNLKHKNATWRKELQIQHLLQG